VLVNAPSGVVDSIDDELRRKLLLGTGGRPALGEPDREVLAGVTISRGD